MNIFKLLVVDDDEDDFIIIRDIISEVFDDFEIDWASSAANGRMLMSKNIHDICLLDVNLGDDSGMKLLKEAKDIGFLNPIIMLTGNEDKKVDLEAASSGAEDYLVKGKLSNNQVSRSIRYALVRKQSIDDKLRSLSAEAESKAKSQFLANLTHEIRSPLTSILGYSELLSEKKFDKDVLEKISIIHRNGQHLLNLINDVLDLSKIESGKINLVVSEVDFEKFLTSVYKSMEINAIKKQLKLKLHFNSLLPESIQVDTTRLRQILINIISNAIKYTKKGKIDIYISAEQKENISKLNFKVVDTGIGIENDKIDTVFDPFRQVEDSASFTDGAGLGLSISKELINKMGGQIYLKSTLGIGTEFYFHIDVETVINVQYKEFDIVLLDKLPTDKKNKASKAGRFSNTKKILIVDDLDDVRDLLGGYVKDLNSQPLYAKNGLEAINMIEQGHKIDAVFMDIQMPIIDGFTAARSIRALRPNLYMCALTASTALEDIRRAYESGFDSFATKPITKSELYELIDNGLEKSFQPENTINQSTKVDSAKDNSTKDRRVLVIDDNSDVLHITQRLLTHCGWSSSTASSGEEALDILRKKDTFYDLIFMDLGLPDTSAKELITRIKELDETLDIIIVSGQEASEAIKAFPNVKTTLLKPVTLGTLQKILSNA